MSETIVVSIYKAQAVGDTETPDTIVNLIEEFPRPDPATVHLDCENPHTPNALKLERALWAALPGGTYDCLLARMMQRRASLLIVGYGGLEAHDA